jgi:hypothetical protein
MRVILFIILATVLGFWLLPAFFQKPSVIPDDSALIRLSDVEKQYYHQVFDYVMEAVKAGESYSWTTGSGSGNIYVSPSFQSKSDATCRVFSERYIVNGIDETKEGVACKREQRDGWCRLKKTDAQTCALEAPGNVKEKALRTSSDFLESTKDLLGRVAGWVR